MTDFHLLNTMKHTRDSFSNLQFAGYTEGMIVIGSGVQSPRLPVRHDTESTFVSGCVRIEPSARHKFTRLASCHDFTKIIFTPHRRGFIGGGGRHALPKTRAGPVPDCGRRRCSCEPPQIVHENIDDSKALQGVDSEGGSCPPTSHYRSR